MAPPESLVPEHERSKCMPKIEGVKSHAWVPLLCRQNYFNKELHFCLGMCPLPDFQFDVSRTPGLHWPPWPPWLPWPPELPSSPPSPPGYLNNTKRPFSISLVKPEHLPVACHNENGMWVLSWLTLSLVAHECPVIFPLLGRTTFIV